MRDYDDICSDIESCVYELRQLCESLVDDKDSLQDRIDELEGEAETLVETVSELEDRVEKLEAEAAECEEEKETKNDN
jgi:chromosome segregation ATPase